jgi:hypothetical protein
VKAEIDRQVRLADSRLEVRHVPVGVAQPGAGQGGVVEHQVVGAMRSVG